MKKNILTNGERFLMDNNYNLAGGFSSALYKVICKADIYNIEKLKLGFPEEVQAVQKYMNEEGYWESIQKKLNR